MSTTTKKEYHYGVGRRKASTARAKVYPGKKFAVTVNFKPLKEYFPLYYCRTIENMLQLVSYEQGSIDLFIRGGGIMGQAEAARLAISKALIDIDEAYKPILRLHGFVSTDIRKVLSKRPGFRKARKREQWSKR